MIPRSHCTILLLVLLVVLVQPVRLAHARPKIHRHASYTLYPMRIEGRASPLEVLASYAPKDWKPLAPRPEPPPPGSASDPATSAGPDPEGSEEVKDDDNKPAALPRAQNLGLGAPQMRSDVLAAAGVLPFDWVPLVRAAGEPAQEQDVDGSTPALTEEEMDRDDPDDIPASSSVLSPPTTRRGTPANVTVTKLHLWDAFPATSHDALSQRGHLIHLANPHRHFAFHPPRGGCSALKEDGGLEKTSENARRNKCRVATNAGFFDTRVGVVKQCFNGLVTRDGVFVQKSHRRALSEQKIRNVHFGLTDHGYFFTGYMNNDLWLRHLTPDSKVPTDIDDISSPPPSSLPKAERDRLTSARKEREAWGKEIERQRKMWVQQVEGRRTKAREDAEKRGFRTSSSARRGFHMDSAAGANSIRQERHVDSETRAQYTVTTVKKDTKSSNQAQRRLLQALKQQQQQQTKKRSPPSSSSSSSPPPPAEVPLTYETLTSTPSDWKFSTLLAGVMWLVRDGREYLDQSIADGEDMTVEWSDCTECTGADSKEGRKLAPGMSTPARDQHFVHINAARTAIGHTLDGSLVILSMDGDGHDYYAHPSSSKPTSKDFAQLEMPGVTLHDMARLLISFGVLNAINLDGGGSATVAVDGVVSNYPGDSYKAAEIARAPELQHLSRYADKYGSPFAQEREVSTITCIYDDDEPAEGDGGVATPKVNVTQVMLNLTIALGEQHRLEEELNRTKTDSAAALAEEQKLKQSLLAERDSALSSGVSAESHMKAEYESQLWLSHFLLSLLSLFTFFLSLAFLAYCFRTRLAEVTSNLANKKRESQGFERVDEHGDRQQRMEEEEDIDVELPVDDEEAPPSSTRDLEASRAKRLVAPAQLMASSLDDAEDLSIDRHAPSARSSTAPSASPPVPSPSLSSTLTSAALSSAQRVTSEERKRDARGADHHQAGGLLKSTYELGDLPSEEEEESEDEEDGEN